MSINATLLSGDSTKISAEAIERFRKNQRGEVFLKGEPGYDEAHIIWSNEYGRRQPAIIARCSGPADVVDAVNFAREHSLLTSIRGGGHGIQGWANNEGGLVIDLSGMRQVWVDPDRRIARVQGGCTLGDVDRETTFWNLAVPTGVAPTTGMGGLTTGGGVGWLHRKYGLTLDNLRSVQIVTADGTVRRVSADMEPDLFWAVRGGGGNFGVITEFEFNAHPISPQMALALVAYSFEDIAGLAENWRDWTVTAPEEVTSRFLSLKPISHPNMDTEIAGRDLVLIGALHSGTYDEGAPHIEPLRRLGKPLLDLSGAWNFRDLQTKFDLLVYGDWSGYWKSVYVDSMEDEVLDVAVKWSQRRPIGTAVTQLLHMGGAVSRVGPTDTAFGDRSPQYLVSAEAAWTQDSDAEACTAWSRGFAGEVEQLPYGRGTYLLFNGESDAASRSAQFGENLDKLRRVKQEYDPTNLFRLNNNIVP